MLVFTSELKKKSEQHLNIYTIYAEWNFILFFICVSEHNIYFLFTILLKLCTSIFTITFFYWINIGDFSDTYSDNYAYSEESRQSPVLEAKTLYVLMPNNVPVSRSRRLHWLLDHINTTVTVPTIITNVSCFVPANHAYLFIAFLESLFQWSWDYFRCSYGNFRF